MLQEDLNSYPAILEVLDLLDCRVYVYPGRRYLLRDQTIIHSPKFKSLLELESWVAPRLELAREMIFQEQFKPLLEAS